MIAILEEWNWLALTMTYIFLYFVFFLGHGSYFSTLSPFVLQHYGENAGLVFTAGQIAFPLGYFFTGFFSDKFRVLRSFLVLSLLIHAPAQFLFYSGDLFGNNLAAGIVFSALNRFLFAVNFQLISIATLESVGTVRFGNVRSWGTVGFFIIHLLLFALETSGGYPAFLFPVADSASITGKFGGVLHLITALFALRIHRYRNSEETYYFKEALALLKAPGIKIFFVLSFLFFFSYQIVDFYLGSFLEQNGGMSSVYAGWSLAVILEIPFLSFSGKIFKRYGVKPLLLLSLFAGTLRFGWLIIYSMGFNGVPIIFSQILHGIHFTGYYMGAIYWMRNSFPDHLYGTGYGAYVIFATSLGAILGSITYGLLLFSKWNQEFTNYFIGTGLIDTTSDSFQFIPLFLLSLTLHAIIFVTYFYIKTPQ